MYPGQRTSCTRSAHHENSGCAAIFKYRDVMSVQTRLGSREGSASMRSSNNPQETSSMTFENSSRIEDASAAWDPRYFSCHVGSELLQAGTSANASKNTSSPSEKYAGRVRRAA